MDFKEFDFKKKTIMDLKKIVFKENNSNWLWGKGPKGNGFQEMNCKEIDFTVMDFKEIDFKKKTIMDLKEIDFKEKTIKDF